jgi:hypothetical protein
MAAREDIARALNEGADAARRGERVTVCPYPRESILRRVWVRGYARVRPLTG